MATEVQRRADEVCVRCHQGRRCAQGHVVLKEQCCARDRVSLDRRRARRVRCQGADPGHRIRGSVPEEGVGRIQREVVSASVDVSIEGHRRARDR